MYILAIDPGVMNLAIAVIELKAELPAEAIRTLDLPSLCGHTRLAHWQRIDLSAGTRNATHAQLCTELIKQLDLMAPLYSRCSAAGIEHQMASNHDANAIQNYALSYFMCRYPLMHVQLIRPLWKTQYLGPLSLDAGVPAHDLTTYGGRKKWSVATMLQCRVLWKEMPDDLCRPALNWQYQLETWNAWAQASKQDDLADAALMILGWLVHTKGRVVPAATTTMIRRKPASTTSLVKQDAPTRAQRKRTQEAFIQAGTADGGVVSRLKKVWKTRRRKLVRK